MAKRVRTACVWVLTFGLAGLAGCGPEDSSPRDGGGDAVGALPDEDADGISDEDEGRAANTDTDGDGTPDYLDDDSDGDGLPDVREAGDADTRTRPRDSDGDTVPDFRDLDSDENGRPDGVDGTDDLDADGVGNFADTDDDGDSLSDVTELGPLPEAPRDTDGDGLADFQDTDSDNDKIYDRHELALDPDGDTIPAYMDLDSDDDCRFDTIEAGDADPSTEPRDSDGDGGGDFVDLDSDNDGLLDSLEDPNCNGALDAGESNAAAADTDGDGVTDLVEFAAGTDPSNPADNPQAHGDFVFVVPYEEPPTPPTDTLDFATSITQADVAFVLDTTGSMWDEQTYLLGALGGIAGTIGSTIPNIALGVAGYADFPYSDYGDPGYGDQPFYLLHRVMTVATAAGLQSVQGAVAAYPRNNGNDGPESGWEALHQVATGAGVNVMNANVPAFNPGAPSPVAGEAVGPIGGVGFRNGSLPIVVWISDYSNHNSEAYPAYYYSVGGAATRDQAVAELLGISARVIGVASQGGDYTNAKAEMIHAATMTGAVVPPSAWGPPGVRPGACADGQCCTGLNDSGEATDGAGQCPLVFTVDSLGSGLGSAIVTAIQVLTTYGVIDIGGVFQDDPTDGVDAVASFVERLEANAVAGAPCAAGLTAVDRNADTIRETFLDVNPGTTVCFDVVPKTNTTVPGTLQPQMFKATIVVTGDGITTLDTRDVYFLVPPEIPDVPIE